MAKLQNIIHALTAMALDYGFSFSNPSRGSITLPPPHRRTKEVSDAQIAKAEAKRARKAAILTARHDRGDI